ncbi:MAG: tRNA(fMet)-specific endonuclease VapC [Verrucomicrobia subdivision 3 bacterium]|nr:tRNA(fMet)-specific endonuclease VapC [Limisphaerales bacterium]MCS1414222.1 tRNA(fMet)-specific endonuclease VapC [Limisphaerales bacterium]
MNRYLLDTDVFIQAKNRHYGFDFCPAFWDWLVEQNRAGRVASIEKVAEELYSGEDELVKWAEKRSEAFFLRPDSAVLAAAPAVSKWANSNNYKPAAVHTFLQVADYWLVAHALAHDWTVVTHEVRNDSAKKIKIPNACIGLGLRCVTPYEMLRRERARFVLARVAVVKCGEGSP